MQFASKSFEENFAVCRVEHLVVLGWSMTTTATKMVGSVMRKNNLHRCINALIWSVPCTSEVSSEAANSCQVCTKCMLGVDAAEDLLSMGRD